MRSKLSISKLVFIGYICLFVNVLNAQIQNYTFEDIQSISSDKQKNILVFMHTEWCRYCQAMKQTTFKDSAVIETINDRYYFISFDAESKVPVNFDQRKFEYKPSGVNTGIHELAEYLAGQEGRVTFPSICILSPDLK